jgi:hypothetical protein
VNSKSTRAAPDPSVSPRHLSLPDFAYQVLEICNRAYHVGDDRQSMVLLTALRLTLDAHLFYRLAPQIPKPSTCGSDRSVPKQRLIHANAVSRKYRVRRLKKLRSLFSTGKNKSGARSFCRMDSSFGSDSHLSG